MLKDILKAERSIFIEMYIFLDDTSESHNFVDALKAKAQAGVRVTIIADALGTFTLRKSAIAAMRSAGIEFIFFSHFLKRSHRKLIIVDETICYLGGINIEKSTTFWNDIGIRIKGKKISRTALKSFNKMYKMSGGKNPPLIKGHKPILKKLKTILMTSLPGHGNYPLVDYYQNRFLNAQTSIKIITPYFNPPRWLMALFDSARKRGVEVEVIIPRDTDIMILNKVSSAHIYQLKDLGIKFYSYPRMNHAKVLIIDNHEALIGSQNLDVFSFKMNMESGVATTDEKAVADMLKIFNAWKLASLDFNTLNYHPNFLDYIIIFVFKFFYWIL